MRSAMPASPCRATRSSAWSARAAAARPPLVLAALALLPDTALVTGGDVIFEGKSLLTLAERDLRELRGRRLAAVFQDPMSALNPCSASAPR